MNIVDVIIFFIIIFSGVIGMKKGFIKSFVSFTGIIVVFILSFLLKDRIADWFCINLPFFDFSGSFKGATILNVIVYQLLAFIIVFSILIAAYHLIVRISGIVERLVKLSIVLIIPTKIGGLVVGLLEGVIISLIGIVILSLPVLKFDLIEESVFRKYLYNLSPIVGNVTKDLNNSVDEIIELKDKFEKEENKEDFNLSALDIIIKHRIIKKDLANKLISGGKLKINSEKAQIIIDKY